MLRAAWELARARRQFARLDVRQIEQRNAEVQGSAQTAALAPRQKHRISWIAYVIPRVAARVPWRSDCLVQALAGQNWLRRAGLASRIVIGVEQPRDGGFGSHAWLECFGITVTGGDIDGYTVMLGRP